MGRVKWNMCFKIALFLRINDVSTGYYLPEVLLNHSVYNDVLNASLRV